MKHSKGDWIEAVESEVRNKRWVGTQKAASSIVLMRQKSW